MKFHDMRARDMQAAEARSFGADFARSRHNADISGCSECRGRRACDYCGHRAVLVGPELPIIEQEAT